MRNQAKVARPAARKDTSGGRVKKTVAVSSGRKSSPIIQLVERRSSPEMTAVTKKVGVLPTPIASFVF